MAEVTKSLELLLGVKTEGTEKLDKVRKSLMSITDVLNASLGKRKSFDFNKQLKFDAVAASAKTTARNIMAATKESERFKMEWLGALFFGQAVSRVFSGALRAIHNTFQKVESNTSALSNATIGLSASWEFLKFSIFNALDQPFILRMVDGLIKMINMVSSLANRFPVITSQLVIIGGLFALGGVILSGVAAWKLGMDSLNKILKTTNLSLGTASNKLTAIKGLAEGLGNMGALTLLFQSAFAFTQKDFADGISAALIGAGWYIKGPFGAALAAVGLLMQFIGVAGANNSDLQRWFMEAMTIGTIFRWNPALGAFALTAVLLFEGIKFGGGFEGISNLAESFGFKSPFKIFDEAFAEASEKLVPQTTGFNELFNSTHKAKAQVDGYTAALNKLESETHPEFIASTKGVIGNEEEGLLGVNKSVVNATTAFAGEEGSLMKAVSTVSTTTDTLSNQTIPRVIEMLNREAAVVEDVTRSYEALARAKGSAGGSAQNAQDVTSVHGVS